MDEGERERVSLRKARQSGVRANIRYVMQKKRLRAYGTFPTFPYIPIFWLFGTL